MPSSTAALVAFKASVTLSFLSPTSVSLAPPTYDRKINNQERNIKDQKLHVSLLIIWL